MPTLKAMVETKVEIVEMYKANKPFLFIFNLNFLYAGFQRSGNQNHGLSNMFYQDGFYLRNKHSAHSHIQ